MAGKEALPLKEVLPLKRKKMSIASAKQSARGSLISS